MNKHERGVQERLAWNLAILVRERRNGSDDTDLEASINRASKALYEYHERIIQPSKPQATRTRKPKVA